jgi:hypothetical protein
MKTKMNSICFVFLFVIILGCSDSLGVDDNVKEKDKGDEDWSKYFMWETGNYWYLDNYFTDKDGNETVWEEGQKQEVMKSVTFQGRKCLEGPVYTSSMYHHMTVYHYIDGSKFYSSGNTFFINWAFDTLKIWDGNNWVLTCDLNSENSWIGYEDNDIEVNMPDYSFKGRIKIHGYLDGDTTITVKDSIYECKRVINICDIEGTITYQNEEYNVGNPYRMTIMYYYSKGAGWLGWRVSYQTPYFPWVRARVLWL